MLETTDGLNLTLARLLGAGIWTACGLIACGMLLSAAGVRPHFDPSILLSAGIVVLISLPVLRVAAMGIWFLFRRDFSFALIAALVLAIILVSTLLGGRPA
jgi:uncharacterized membrane protein